MNYTLSKIYGAILVLPVVLLMCPTSSVDRGYVQLISPFKNRFVPSMLLDLYADRLWRSKSSITEQLDPRVHS